MKKILFILFGILLMPVAVFAAYNDVTVSEVTDIVLPSNGLSYSLQTSTEVESFTINNSTINFNMLENSVIEIKSTDRSSFDYGTGTGCTLVENTCYSTVSTIKMNCETGVALVITPGAVNSCSVNSGGGGFSVGGGGSSQTTAPEDAKTDTTVVLNLNNPFTLSLSLSDLSHTVTVTSATDETVEFTIESEPLEVSINKNETIEIDTDGDGVDDLRVTYSGFDASDNRPKLRFIELAASTGVKEGASMVVKGGPPVSECALSVGKAFKEAGSLAVYYITKDCKKRAFNNSRVFFTYFDSWGEVNSVQQSSLDDITDDGLGFMPWGPKYDPKYGALVKIVTDPKTYLLLGTEKYWITDEVVFEALGYSWNWIEDIDKALLDKYTTGSEINYTDRHPNFTLVKYANDPRVYRLEDSKKRHVKNEEAFERLKYRWDRIVEIGDDETYEDGEELE